MNFLCRFLIVSTMNLFCIFVLFFVNVCFFPVVILLTSSRVKNSSTFFFMSSNAVILFRWNSNISQLVRFWRLKIPMHSLTFSAFCIFSWSHRPLRLILTASLFLSLLVCKSPVFEVWVLHDKVMFSWQVILASLSLRVVAFFCISLSVVFLVIALVLLSAICYLFHLLFWLPCFFLSLDRLSETENELLHEFRQP